MKYKYRRYFIYYIGRAFIAVLQALPYDVAVAVANFAGRVAYLVLAKYRNIAIENLKMAFGAQKTDREIRRIALGVFQNLAKNGAELINFPKIEEYNIDRFVTIENRDILDDGLKRGKGVIIVTAHFGNWEFLALTVRLKRYQGAVIGRRIYFHKYDSYLNYLRKSGDVNIIYRDESPRKILKVLKANKIMGILADQDVDSVDGVFVDFFGRPAFTPAGPVALAMVSGAALIPAVILRDGKRHRLILERQIELTDTGDKEKDIVENTAKWSGVIESYIRRYPEQWVWLHRRWKTVRDKDQR